jgi:hypothetical protein
MRFDLTVMTTTALNILALRHLGTPEEGVTINFVRNEVTYDRLIGSTWVTDTTVRVTLPIRPSTNALRITLDRDRGTFHVMLDGMVLAMGTGMIGTLSGTWGIDMYGDSAVNASIDNVTISTTR